MKQMPPDMKQLNTYFSQGSAATNLRGCG